MTRKKSHKPGGEPRQTKQHSKTVVGLDTPAPPDAEKLTPTISPDPSVEKVDTLDASDRPTKRARVGDMPTAEIPRFANPAPEDNTCHVEHALAFNIPVSILPLHLQSLQAKYDFSTMSIISSSKIETKVKTLLARLGTFSCPDKGAKPAVVILSAKAGVANKMISVVEIAKREIEAQGAKWWQYSRVHSQLTELKGKPGKGTEGGKTLRQRENEQDEKKVGELHGVKDVAVDSAMADVGGGDDAEEDAFETAAPMGNGTTGVPAEEIAVRKKIRAVPIMTIHLSRVPVDELKQAYGCVSLSCLRATGLANILHRDQTNA